MGWKGESHSWISPWIRKKWPLSTWMMESTTQPQSFTTLARWAREAAGEENLRERRALVIQAAPWHHCHFYCASTTCGCSLTGSWQPVQFTLPILPWLPTFTAWPSLVLLLDFTHYFFKKLTTLLPFNAFPSHLQEFPSLHLIIVVWQVHINESMSSVCSSYWLVTDPGTERPASLLQWTRETSKA